MKTLIISDRNDFRLYSLIAPLQKIMEVGFMKKYEAVSYEAFNADIVFTDEIHNSPDGYDLSNLSKLNPFINFNVFVEAKYTDKYKSDMSYIGPISDMDSSMIKFHNLGYNVRNFYGSPSMLSCYSGSITMDKCWNVYRSAKICPIPKNDIGYRELDIIAAGGNPLKYTNTENFIEEAIKGVKGKQFAKITTKDDILYNRTNYEVVSNIVENMGFRAVANKIRQEKSI
jgi:hypothetical protein